MRVCMILPVHQAALAGGAQYQAYLLACELASRPNVDVVSIVRQGPSTGYAGPDRIVELGFVPRSWALGTYLYELPRLWLTLKRLRPDIIYQRVGCSYTGIAALYAKHHGARFVWHVARDDDTQQEQMDWRSLNPLRIIEQLTYEYGKRRSNDIVVQHDVQASNLMMNYGVKRVRKIPNGHPVPEFTQRVSTERKIVVWLANLKPSKQPEIFLEAVANLSRRHDVEWIMIGESQLPPEALQHFRKTVLATSGVKYLGGLPHKQAAAWLDRAHLLVNTSRIEGFSNTFIEAWLRGVPVVSLNSNPDQLLSGEYPLGICADGDFIKLVKAIDRLLIDDKYHALVSNRCINVATEHYSTQNIKLLADHLLAADV